MERYCCYLLLRSGKIAEWKDIVAIYYYDLIAEWKDIVAIYY